MRVKRLGWRDVATGGIGAGLSLCHCEPTGRSDSNGSDATTSSFPAKAGDPVRCGFSVQSLLSLEYWVTRLRG